jgi:hypothetical protein
MYVYFKALVKTSHFDDPAVFVMESIHLKRFGRKGNNQKLTSADEGGLSATASPAFAFWSSS